MLITRKSLVSGKVHTLDLPVTEAQLQAYGDGDLLQDAFPDLSPPLREFIKTGITPAEWQTEVLGVAEDGRSITEADAPAVIGKVQRRSDGNFGGYIDIPDDTKGGDRLNCLMVQDRPELGGGYDFMLIVRLND